MPVNTFVLFVSEEVWTFVSARVSLEKERSKERCQ